MSSAPQFISNGVISEPPQSTRVNNVFGSNYPHIKSYAESAMDYQVVKPTTTFALAEPDEFLRWRTDMADPPQTIPLARTLGKLSSLYGFNQATTAWSPSCYNLECPAVNQPAGSVMDPWVSVVRGKSGF